MEANRMGMNLRDFLKKMDEQGEVVHIRRQIPLDDIGKVLMRAYHEPDRPVIMFHKPGGLSVPLVGNVFSSREKAAVALGTSVEELNQRVHQALNVRIKPVTVNSAPCQEVVIPGEDVDLSTLPIPKYSPDDGGPYVTPGIVVSRDPETGVYDMGHYRFQVIGKNRFAFFAQQFHRFGANIIKAKKMGKPISAALVIGYDPALGYAGQAKVGESDDFEVAGGFLGEPLKLVRCKTIDSLTPASAEFVFELEIDYENLFNEGPLGEYTGYYTPPFEKPTAKIMTITHRKDPIFQALLTGRPSPITENHILKEIPFEASLYGDLKNRFPTLHGVHIPPFGGVQAAVIISMSPRFPGEAKQALLTVLGSFVAPKWAIVVDPDINIFDMNDVWWAMSFRVRPERDLFTVGDTLPVPVDPAYREHAEQEPKTAVGIDATIPVHVQYPKVADVPGWESMEIPEFTQRDREGK
jgi:2,5-furandicarboxylate decarboxylase 1